MWTRPWNQVHLGPVLYGNCHNFQNFISLSKIEYRETGIFYCPLVKSCNIRFFLLKFSTKWAYYSSTWKQKDGFLILGSLKEFKYLNWMLWIPLLVFDFWYFTVFTVWGVLGSILKRKMYQESLSKTAPLLGPWMGLGSSHGLAHPHQARRIT